MIKHAHTASGAMEPLTAGKIKHALGGKGMHVPPGSYIEISNNIYRTQIQKKWLEMM